MFWRKYWVVSGLPGTSYSMCWLGVFYHIGILKDPNNMAYKWFNNPYVYPKSKQDCGGAAPLLFNKQNIKI